MDKFPVLYLSASTDAVDVSLLTKRDAVLNFVKRNKYSLGEIAAIGDSENDLPFLEIEGLGLVGAPFNAQKRVKDVLQSKSNYIALTESVLAGFMEFYALAAKRGIKHIISDRDGVLIWKGATAEEIATLKGLLLKQTRESPPTITVLTGSSVEQNIRFITDYALADRAYCSSWVLKHPTLIWAENGSAVMNVLSGEVERNLPDGYEPAALKLKGSFEAQARAVIEETVLRKWGFTFSFSQDDQDEKVYLPQKETMVTFNMPHSSKDEPEFRKSKQVLIFQQELISVLAGLADQAGFHVVRI